MTTFLSFFCFFTWIKRTPVKEFLCFKGYVMASLQFLFKADLNFLSLLFFIVGNQKKKKQMIL